MQGPGLSNSRLKLLSFQELLDFTSKGRVSGESKISLEGKANILLGKPETFLTSSLVRPRLQSVFKCEIERFKFGDSQTSFIKKKSVLQQFLSLAKSRDCEGV